MNHYEGLVKHLTNGLENFKSNSIDLGHLKAIVKYIEQVERGATIKECCIKSSNNERNIFIVHNNCGEHAMATYSQKRAKMYCENKAGYYWVVLEIV